MKKLLANGSGPIYQICKAFRYEPCGRHHNPEFTMLEWYRPGFDHHQLMDEVGALITATLGVNECQKHSYQQVFLQHLAIDPMAASVEEIIDCVEKNNIQAPQLSHKDDWLDLLFSHCIQPKLKTPTFIFDYPASQAALAKIRPCTPPVAERFELFIDGIELANGYHELCDSKEQHARFLADNKNRLARGLPTLPIDNELLQALDNNFPACAGVALGVDRLLMLKENCGQLSDIINFTTDLS